jgi:hypothetical protein
MERGESSEGGRRDNIVAAAAAKRQVQASYLEVGFLKRIRRKSRREGVYRAHVLDW